MKPTPYLIQRDRPGRLATMACPRGGDWLADEVEALRLEEVDVLVSALTDSELSERQLTAEPELAIQAGLAYISFPIRDRGIPSVAAVTDLVGHLEELLTAGQFVVIHCRAGIGRSSLIAAAVLVREGLSPNEAWQRIEAARGLAVPDTEEQRTWLAEFAWTHDVGHE
jgi:protein-tyrosine phosphatase